MVGSRLCLALALVLAAGLACKENVLLPTEEIPERDLIVVARPPSDRQPSPGQTKVLGTGWYANVEIDAKGVLHFAWTDADLGDVMYTRWEPEQPAPVPPQPVELDGAAGGYLQLVLGPGDAPILSYYHQDRRVLRLAHRPADLPKMKAAGAVLVAPLEAKPVFTPLVPGEKAPRQPSEGMGPGWHGEDVAFGDQVGMAGKLFVDQQGRPHLTYYTKNERFRYARRPASKDAFGPLVNSIFEKYDVDERAGGSYTMSTDLAVTKDGTAVVSYCHWNYIDSVLRVGWLAPGKSDFEVVDAAKLDRIVDGWHSALVPIDDHQFEVFSVATAALKLFSGRFDTRAPKAFAERQVWVERPGPTVVKRAANGTFWVLTRGQGFRSLGEEPGVWLIEIPQGDPGAAKRKLLERGSQRDPWLDLVIRPDGRPVAVWTSTETDSMRMYAP